MLSIITAGALALATPGMAQPAGTQAAASQSVDPARRDAARAVVEEVLPPADRQRMFATLVNAMMRNMTAGMVQGGEMAKVFAANPKAKTVFDAFVERQRGLALDDLRTHTPELIDAYIDAYARAFDVAELGQLKVWLGSPIGQKYIGFAFAIGNEPAIAAWQRGVAERGQQRLPGELERLKAELTPILDKSAP